MMQAVLPSAEAEWIARGRSRPLLLLGCMRRVLHTQLRAGTLEPIVYRKLDEDLKVVATLGCRLTVLGHSRANV